jgi:hypothetical protein
MSETQFKSLEEARRKLEETRARLGGQVNQAKEQFAGMAAALEIRLTYVKSAQAKVEAVRQDLSAKRNDPVALYHYASMDALSKFYGETRRAIEIQLACYRANIALFDAPTLPENPSLLFPQQDPDYLESNVKQDYYLALFHWVRNAIGIDLVLRIATEHVVFEHDTPGQAAMREAQTDEIQEAMSEDAKLENLVNLLGAEFKASWMYLDWAENNLKRLPKLSPVDRLKLLSDADWAKLGAKAEFLGGLYDRVKGHPVLARYFPAPDAASRGLPFGAAR